MRRFASAAALALAAALAAPARAEVDVEVPATFKAKGTLSGDYDTYRFDATTGAVLTLKAASAKGAAIGLAVELRDPMDNLVDPGAPVATPSKVQWKQVVLPASGRYALHVSAEGAGDYALAVSVKPKTSWSGTLDLGIEDTDSLDFAAPAGSLLSFRSAPAPGSACNPVLESYTPVDQAVELVETVKGTVHTATAGPLDVGGDMYVSVFNDSANVGAAVASVRVKPPKVRPGKVDLRASVLGRPGGGETLVGRMVDSSGGTVAVADEASDLFGAAVVLPADALGAPTLISVASATDPALGAEDDQAAGPAVRLEPSGLTFPVPVEVTLPFDFTKIPAGSSAEDIRIRIVEDNGTATEVAPTFVGANTVTIPTNGFSICIPIIESGPPNYGYTSLGTLKPGGDEFWLLQIAAEIFPGGGNDSRIRTLETSVGQVSIHGDGTLDVALANHGFAWTNQDSPPMSGQPITAGITEYTSDFGGTLDWAYDSTGTKMVLTGGDGDQPVFRVSRDGRYFAGAKEGSTEPYADVQFGVRKNTKALGTASLKGAWTACFLEFDADQNGTTGAAGPKPARAYGTFTFDGAGNCAIAFAQRNSSFDENTGNASQPLESFNLQDATYSIEGNGTILVVVPPIDGEETGTTLRLFPGEGLDVLFAGHDPPLGSAAMALVLVRQGTGLSRTDLDGRYHGASFGIDLGSYGVPSTPKAIPDFAINLETLAGTFDGGSVADFTGTYHHSQRDPANPDGTRTENEPEEFSVAVGVTSPGRMSLAAEGKVIGQATPDGQAMILVSDTASATADFSLFFLFRSPPVKNP